jgi:hypothetical protein
MDTKLVPKNATFFYCEYCDFECSKQSNYITHTLTSKHKKRYNMIQNETILSQKNAEKSYYCKCGKKFMYHSGLWRHKKTCQDTNETKKKINETHNFDPFDDKDLMKQVILQLPELVKSIVEISKDKGINQNHSHNQTHSHSHNKTFNLQFFLNETCKDAMNISDFVQTIKPQLMDLETTGRIGYVDGITNIIVNNLKTLKIHERPLHCSDQKREVLYIKDNDIWTKEDDDKPILTKAIKVIANENIKNIGEWRKEYPDCTDSDSKKNSLYLKIVSNSMSGSSKEESDKNLHKIISNISKEVIIDKN